MLLTVYPKTTLCLLLLCLPIPSAIHMVLLAAQDSSLKWSITHGDHLLSLMLFLKSLKSLQVQSNFMNKA